MVILGPNVLCSYYKGFFIDSISLLHTGTETGHLIFTQSIFSSIFTLFLKYIFNVCFFHPVSTENQI